MNRLSIPIVAAFAMLSAAPAIAADQYDLVCKGTEQKKTGVAATPWKETFRIDLATKRWCRGACTSAGPISSITPDEIVIMDTRRPGTGPADAALWFSRTSGKVREYVEAGWSGSSFDIANGTCVRDLYSGMPGQKF